MDKAQNTNGPHIALQTVDNIGPKEIQYQGG